ncbi:MAG: para-aminobenzoate synthetase component [Frankiales bacterium]|nr:para-aminobenzoate synthetase component [Frankiales bacterium]
MSAHAVVGGRLATGLADVTDDPSCLDSSGFWAVVTTFEGGRTFARFTDVRPFPGWESTPWNGIGRDSWQSSLDRDEYVAAVAQVRERIAEGELYQANICRVLSAPLAASTLVGLAARLSAANPAPYSSLIELPDHGVQVACASPELFLRRRGRQVESRPIKGTARTAEGLTAKDRAENVMIVDLVRNDLSRVASSGSVKVPALCAVEQHPGLVHLVSTVSAELEEGRGWADLLDATSPAGSVSGAPKSSALRVIGELERGPRGAYCGAIGWVDADAAEGVLAVGIRTFWADGGELRFGTGAGITWGSDPQAEWAETELKAAHLLAVAAGQL